MDPFDPLAVEHVGVTLAVEFLEQPMFPLPPEAFAGAGVYAIYYTGEHPAYADLHALWDGEGGTKLPIYVGSAMRENAKQGFNPRPTTEQRIFSRLENHADSIRDVEVAAMEGALRLTDFQCRYLVLNDAYITLAESVMITTFRPAWNGMGLGSKVVGGNRMGGRPSLWDSLHPGRAGRPAGSEARAEQARRSIAESIRLLGSSPPDPRAVRMIEKIRRFV